MVKIEVIDSCEDGGDGNYEYEAGLLVANT